MTQRGLVILDRDGVINEDSANFIRCPADWIPIPGSIEAMARLSQAGYEVAVATNQSGIARGLLDESMLALIHERMREQVQRMGGTLAAVAYCPHGPDDGCRCRKPAPGLLQQISARLQRPLQGVPFVGDSARDLDAADAAGCAPVLVRTGNGRRTEAGMREGRARVFDDLSCFTEALLASDASGGGMGS